MAEQDLHRRIIELESRVAFQEQSLTDLSDVVARQQREIERAGRQLAELGQYLRGLQAAISAVPADEPPPPHY